MKKEFQFIILVCAISWLIAIIAITLGLSLENAKLYTVFAAFYMLLPAVSAVILQLKNREKPFRNLNVSFKFNRWFIVAGLTPLVCAVLTLAVNNLFPGMSISVTFEGALSSLPEEQAEDVLQQLSRFPPALFLLFFMLQSLVAGYTINAVFAFGEEFGWRGYLLKAMNNQNFLKVSLVTGIVWGIWHFPLILLGHNYPQHSVPGVGMMIIMCVLLSPVMTYIVIKSRSVLTAAFYHGTFNASAGLTILYIKGGNDLTNGVTGLAGFLALLLINAAFFAFDRFVTKEGIFTKPVSF